MQWKQLREPCKKCGTVAWERLQRNGFFEERILPFFNQYPWRCAICNNRRYLPLRAGPPRRAEQPDDE